MEIKRYFKELFHKGWENQPSYRTLAEHVCICGKKLRDHKFNDWELLKEYYDLGTCDFGERTVNSRSNGWGLLHSYFYVKSKYVKQLNDPSLSVKEKRKVLKKHFYS